MNLKQFDQAISSTNDGGAGWGLAAEQPQLVEQRSERSLILLTADDTESRLLAGIDPQRLRPFAVLPWILGGWLPRDGIQTGDTWITSLGRTDGVLFQPLKQRPATVTRPALAPTWRATSATARQLVRSTLPTRSSAEVTAVEAGWLQLLDDLDASHQCSQSIEGRGRHQSGDYWHAIMHRREPDYGNSQYWFHQFSRHPVFESLPEEVDRVAAMSSNNTFAGWTSRLVVNGRWDAIAFVACCREAASSPDAHFRSAVEELQYREMLLLLRQSLMDASS